MEPESLEELCYEERVVLDERPATSVAFVSFNDDDHQDIVFTGPQGSFLAEGLGDGEFADPVDLGIEGEGLHIGYYPYLEGKELLVITTTNPDRVVTFSASFAQAFDPPVSSPTGPGAFDSSPAPLDLPNDSVDLLVVNADAGTIVSYLDEGEGQFVLGDEMPVGGRPVQLEYVRYSELHPLGWNVAVLDAESNSIVFVQVFDGVAEVIESHPLPPDSNFFWVTWEWTYSPKILVGSGSENTLSIWNTSPTWELHAQADWPGGPVSGHMQQLLNQACCSGPLVALRDKGAVAIGRYCDSGDEATCQLEPPALVVDGLQDPVDVAMGRIVGSSDLVVASPESGVTLLLESW